MFTINARATSELAATPVSSKKRGEVSVRRSSTKACLPTGTPVCLGEVHIKPQQAHNGDLTGTTRITHRGPGSQWRTSHWPQPVLAGIFLCGYHRYGGARGGFLLRRRHL